MLMQTADKLQTSFAGADSLEACPLCLLFCLTPKMEKCFPDAYRKKEREPDFGFFLAFPSDRTRLDK